MRLLVIKIQLRPAIVIVATLFQLSSFGQVDFVEHYFPYIHEADLEVVNGNYARGLELYSQAFDNVLGGFSFDYANAAVCAAKTNHMSLALRYLDSLVSKGVEREFLETFNGLEPLRQSAGWATYMTSYDVRRRNLLKNFNENLRHQLTSMHDLDQEFRTKEGSYRVYGDTISKIDKRNVEAYIYIIEKYGFPNEDLLGIRHPGVQIPAYIVLHHHCQAMSVKKEVVTYDFTVDFIEAVRKGRLEPHIAAFLIAMQGENALQLGGWGVTRLESNGVESKLLVSKYEENVLAEISDNRKAFGLESLDEYYKKVIFKFQNSAAKDFIFDKYGQLNIFEGLDEATYLRLVNAFESIE